MTEYRISVFGRQTSFQTSEPISKSISRRLAASPDTRVDSGGRVGEFSFDGQRVDHAELRDVKEMRESGGLIASLVRMKALMYFGTGAELSIPEEQEEEEIINGEPMTQVEFLRNQFDSLETTMLEVGEDSIWYPYGAIETKETRDGEFSRIIGIEPWTIIPKVNKHGEIIAWQQETIHNGQQHTQTFPAAKITHFPVNKRSARDEIGISAVLRSEEEIEQYKENQRAMRNAIEMHGFPEWHVAAGREGGAPLDDNELRRIINLFENRRSNGDTVTATGPDVELNRLDPGDIALEEVTSNDLQQLAISLGVPIEAVDFGSEGLGSGEQSKLRETILKLDILATQRMYSNQWETKVLTPVLERYSPFDHTVDIHVKLNDPMTGKEEMADLIQKVGAYMETNEARQKLDLEPKEELEGDFGKPEQANDDEGFGGGGFFSDDGMRQLQEIPDNAYPIQDRSECDGQVVTGPRGGLKCIPEEDGGSGNGRDKDDGDDEGDGSVSTPATATEAKELEEKAESGALISDRDKFWNGRGGETDVFNEDFSEIDEISEGDIVRSEGGTFDPEYVGEIVETDPENETITLETVSEGEVTVEDVDSSRFNYKLNEDAISSAETPSEIYEETVESMSEEQKITAVGHIVQNSDASNRHLPQYEALLDSLSEEQLHDAVIAFSTRSSEQTGGHSNLSLNDLAESDPVEPSDDVPSQRHLSRHRMGYLFSRMEDPDAVKSAVDAAHDELTSDGNDNHANMVVSSAAAYSKTPEARREIFEDYEEEMAEASDSIKPAIEMQFTDDTEEFKELALSEWVRSEANSASHHLMQATQDVGPNTEDNSEAFTTFLGSGQNSFGVPLNSVEPTEEFQEHIETMRTEAQEYYEDNETPTIYRGVSQEVTTHGTLESWSESERVAESFDGHSVLEAEIDAEDILISEEMMGEDWPSPENVERSEREIIAFGGGFNNE